MNSQWNVLLLQLLHTPSTHNIIFIIHYTTQTIKYLIISTSIQLCFLLFHSSQKMKTTVVQGQKQSVSVFQSQQGLLLLGQAQGRLEKA